MTTGRINQVECLGPSESRHREHTMTSARRGPLAEMLKLHPYGSVEDGARGRRLPGISNSCSRATVGPGAFVRAASAVRSHLNWSAQLVHNTTPRNGARRGGRSGGGPSRAAHSAHGRGPHPKPPTQKTRHRGVFAHTPRRT